MSNKIDVLLKILISVLCVLITASFQSLMHTAFLAWISYRLYTNTPLAITYDPYAVTPSIAYPTAPIKEADGYVL